MDRKSFEKLLRRAGPLREQTWLTSRREKVEGEGQVAKPEGAGVSFAGKWHLFEYSSSTQRSKVSGKLALSQALDAALSPHRVFRRETELGATLSLVTRVVTTAQTTFEEEIGGKHHAGAKKGRRGERGE